MDPQEIDIQLDELENRLDRLRALYEQYFLGIEKIEPAVARKDVDRRFWMLRKLQIRNTARRFRLQVIVQRYNTFQQYWARICREIENGTYVRHLIKAQKNVGFEPKTWAARKRLGLLKRGDPDAPEGGPEPGAADLAALLESNSDLGAEAERAAAKALENAERAHAVRAATGARKFEDLGPLDLDLDDDEVPPRPARPVPVAGNATPNVGGAPAQKPAPAPNKERSFHAPGQSAGVADGRAAVPKPALPVSSAPASASAARARVPLPPVAANAKPPTGSALTDDNVKRLHAQLIASRRQMNQPDNVSLDSFGKSLRDAESKLLAQHKGGSVEFQVVVKDGKPVVKPVVRK